MENNKNQLFIGRDKRPFPSHFLSMFLSRLASEWTKKDSFHAIWVGEGNEWQTDEVKIVHLKETFGIKMPIKQKLSVTVLGT